MPKEKAGTQIEGRRNTKINIEVDKERSEEKMDTKTKVEEDRTQGTALCVGLKYPGSVWNSGMYEGGVDHRITLETVEVLKREYEEKSNGCRGGSQEEDPNPEVAHTITWSSGAKNA